MMVLGEASSLGVFGGGESGKTKVSFSLTDQPFCNDRWFYTQHLIASVLVRGDEEQKTFQPPYVPELNEFFGWEMQMRHDVVRVEPERVGVVVDAARNDSYLYALPVPTLVEKLFEMIGMRAKPSGGGLITRQLDAAVSQDERRCVRTAKPCGPDAPMLASSS
jgi:hypothetical protein